MVGRCLLPCPFCGETVEVEIVHSTSHPPEVSVTMAAEPMRRPVRRFLFGDAKVNARASRPSKISSRERACDEVFAEAQAGARMLAQLNLPMMGTPWEQDGWLVVRWARTIRAVLWSPDRFFRELRADRWGGALSFATIQLTIVATAIFAAEFGRLNFIGVVSVVTATLLAFVYIILCFHAAATRIVGRRVRWAGVGRVAAFGLSPAVWTVLPKIGFPMAVGWIVGLHAIGLRRMLGISLPWAIVVAALPWLTVMTALVMLL
ncbi:MAG: hypothetical protein AAF449_06260 [Myxococcota bacterium]